MRRRQSGGRQRHQGPTGKKRPPPVSPADLEGAGYTVLTLDPTTGVPISPRDARIAEAFWVNPPKEETTMTDSISATITALNSNMDKLSQRVKDLTTEVNYVKDRITPLAELAVKINVTHDPDTMEPIALRHAVSDLAHELNLLREQVQAGASGQRDRDQTNERIVAFLSGLPGVKFNGRAVGENLGLTASDIHGRLHRLAAAGRINEHKAPGKTPMFSGKTQEDS